MFQGSASEVVFFISDGPGWRPRLELTVYYRFD